MQGKDPWYYWEGQKVQNAETREVYIETNRTNWDHRLNTWRKNPDNCPCPMPRGHLMFKKDSMNYKGIT